MKRIPSRTSHAHEKKELKKERVLPNWGTMSQLARDPEGSRRIGDPSADLGRVIQFLARSPPTARGTTSGAVRSSSIRSRAFVTRSRRSRGLSFFTFSSTFFHATFDSFRRSKRQLIHFPDIESTRDVVFLAIIKKKGFFSVVEKYGRTEKKVAVTRAAPPLRGNPSRCFLFLFFFITTFFLWRTFSFGYAPASTAQ